MAKFQLSCESTVDLPFDYVNSRNISVLFYSYSANGTIYEDDMCRNPDAIDAFYAILDAGVVPLTSQLNIQQYIDFFEPLVKKGDLLHLAFGSGMTGSVNNARLAAEMLSEKYPDRRLIVIDSLCSSSGYGLLLDDLADLRDRGSTIDEAREYALEMRNKVHHQFFSTDLQYYRRSGRISGAAATVGAVLNICPIMRLDDRGAIIAYSKVRGVRNAIAETVNTMERHAVGGAEYAGKCWVCHSHCPEYAARLKTALQERFPHIQGEIMINEIGPIIASHCGPGTAAVFFIGDERQPNSK